MRLDVLLWIAILALLPAAPERAALEPFDTAEVHADSLYSIVSFLSIDPGTQEPRSRFSLREGEITLIADSLASRLQEILGVTADRLPFQFYGGDYAPDSLFTNENIYARLSGTGSTGGIFLITAHYDAVASRDDGWIDSWRTHPAPGANDNGSGVAALLELARLLEPYELQFDVGFLLFSAEEIGLIGSTEYVEGLTQAEVDEILGVLNLDMIGYSDPWSLPGVLVMSNPRSGWLADLAVGSFESYDQSLVTRLYRPAVPYYDHKSFWERSVSAITFSEPYSDDYRILFPYYHTERDTIGWVDFEQVERITAAAGNFLVELSGSAGECAMLPSDLHFNWKGYTTTRRSFSAGDTLLLEFRPRNIGATDPSEGASLFLEVTIENRYGRELIHSSMYVPPPPFRSLLVEIPMILEERDAGENLVRARISVNGMADDPSNNETVETFSVTGGSQVVLSHRFQPNPISSSFDNAFFCVDLSRETQLKIELLNLEGELLGRAFMGSGSGRPLAPGLNCFGFDDLFPDIDRLAGGIYLYRLVIFDEAGSFQALNGRFAVEN